MLVGCPPFKSNNILHLASLIRTVSVKWPMSISSDCISLLKGLLEKNPTHRLSWPHLLEHPFVKGYVQLTSDEGDISVNTISKIYILYSSLIS